MKSSPATPDAGIPSRAGLPSWIEVIAAALGLCLLAPLMVGIWLLVHVDSPGPGLFKQQRIGRGGRPFTCYKFRTMFASAAPASVEIADFSSYVFNVEDGRDPRLTRVGAALRRTSMDELPQLLNVMRREMALVGPRPELPEIVERYPATLHRRHVVRPGISGLAQVSGRSDLAYGRIAMLDLSYIERRSPRFDLALLWRTVAIVARAEGAR